MRMSGSLALCALFLTGGYAAAVEPTSEDAAKWSKVPYGAIINHCTVPGVVALTFDDGPHENTHHILDLLDDYGAHATFFVNGDNYGRGRIDDKSTPWPKTLQRMIRAGHQIGSHTWAHVDMSEADHDTRYHQMRHLEQALADVLGTAMVPTYFRPPYATCSEECQRQMEEMGYHVVNFDLDTKDYENNTPDKIAHSIHKFSNALEAGRRGDSFLVLAHDVQKMTSQVLAGFMLEQIRRKGYKAVTVGECLNDPRSLWYRRLPRE
ncbi:hypothetical protein QBC46DRAFT_374995 [Diplogelasinospora grovesii]|uniref:NodB homology domain-containing protein n=1 Tax=Diplogelasinospora grovesii TaxID=303347 RepID=A0AAN6NF44_9PEZI|nr:hypothetical protein QBC46DRAFT_374995 [Diplogelasinospora grovesii]